LIRDFLIECSKSLASGYERKLDNRSKTRGLAYALHELPQSNTNSQPVEGIVHDVPIADLPAFLRFEGVLNRYYKAESSRYEISRAEPQIWKHETKREVEHVSCLVLLGLDRVAEEERPRKTREGNNGEEILRYIRTAMKAAIDFEIDTKPFRDDLADAQTWLPKM
jgi:hypothetical protein